MLAAGRRPERLTLEAAKRTCTCGASSRRTPPWCCRWATSRRTAAPTAVRRLLPISGTGSAWWETQCETQALLWSQCGGRSPLSGIKVKKWQLGSVCANLCSGSGRGMSREGMPKAPNAHLHRQLRQIGRAQHPVQRDMTFNAFRKQRAILHGGSAFCHDIHWSV